MKRDRFMLNLKIWIVSKSCETVEKVSGNDAGSSYEDVLIGSFPLFYLALYSVIAFAHALVPSRATRSWRKIALRQEPHQPFQILSSRGQQELFGNIPQSAQSHPPQSHPLFEFGKERFDLVAGPARPLVSWSSNQSAYGNSGCFVPVDRQRAVGT